MTVSGRTRGVHETISTLGQDSRLGKQPRKHVKSANQTDEIERYLALRQICSSLRNQRHRLVQLRRVATIPTFSSFALIFVFAAFRPFKICSATENCKVVLLSSFRGLVFPSYASEKELISANNWFSTEGIIQPVSGFGLLINCNQCLVLCTLLCQNCKGC